MKRYLLHLAVAFDQLLNALLRGDPDETLSSRAHRLRLKGHKYWGWTAGAIDRLFFWQPGHCEASYHAEIDRLQSQGIQRLIDAGAPAPERTT